MPYLQIGLCIVGASLFFNAGRIEANAGHADHAVLWAGLSLLTSVARCGLVWLAAGTSRIDAGDCHGAGAA